VFLCTKWAREIHIVLDKSVGTQKTDLSETACRGSGLNRREPVIDQAAMPRMGWMNWT
jgi:hypothetical protein